MRRFLFFTLSFTVITDLLLYLHGPLLLGSIPVIGLRMWAPGVAALLAWGLPPLSLPRLRPLIQSLTIPMILGAGITGVAFMIERPELHWSTFSWPTLGVWLTRGTLLAVGEELGWRWGLQNHLQENSAWRKYRTVACVWGLWHVPVLLWSGGISLLRWALFAVMIVAVTVVWGRVWESTRNIWLLAFWHMGHNVWVNQVPGVLWGESAASSLWIGELGLLCVVAYAIMWARNLLR
jgi:membrane protease YdiL (CAAX protease family)